MTAAAVVRAAEPLTLRGPRNDRERIGEGHAKTAGRFSFKVGTGSAGLPRALRLEPVLGRLRDPPAGSGCRSRCSDVTARPGKLGEAAVDRSGAIVSGGEDPRINGADLWYS